MGDETGGFTERRERKDVGEWTLTPWWMPYRWFGNDLRRRVRMWYPTSYGGGWQYGNSRDIARKNLSRQFEAPTQQERSPNWIG